MENNTIVKNGYYIATIKAVYNDMVTDAFNEVISTVIFVLTFITNHHEVTLEYGIYRVEDDIGSISELCKGLCVVVPEDFCNYYNYDTFVGKKCLCYVTLNKDLDDDRCYNRIDRIIPYDEVPETLRKYL